MTDDAVENRHRPAVGRRAIGTIVCVRGSQASIGLHATADGAFDRATVGTLVAIEGDDHTVVGMIGEVALRPDAGASGHEAAAQIDLIGEIYRAEGGEIQFRRGVRHYPAIGDSVAILGRDDLGIMHASSTARRLEVGHLNQDETIPAYLYADQLLSKHFAILGSTGVGKSSGVAAIVDGLIKARPEMRVLLLDVHNEYGRIFGGRATEIGSENLRMPFWLLNFEEMTDIIYGGKPAAPEEVEILAELIPVAKGAYAGYKDGGDRPILAKKRAGPSGFTVDTPSPYQLQDLLGLIDERMGRLENRASRMAHHRLMMRIETIRNDPRYAFLFRDALIGGDSMAAVLAQLFRLETPDQPLSVLKLASLPDETVDAITCVVARLAFEFALWSDGAMPLLLVCEEAHRYASADDFQSFAPARRALKRIAREGRKYGVHLGLVTQRPAELDPTILSQCSTFFVMRMTNDVDQSILRAAVSDSGANLLALVPSLGAQEAVGIGEGMPLPARFIFKTLPREMIPRSDCGSRADATDTAQQSDVLKQAIERWRRATTSQAVWVDSGDGRSEERDRASAPDPRDLLPKHDGTAGGGSILRNTQAGGYGQVLR